MGESISERIDILIRQFADGRNTTFGRMVGESEANIRNYRSGKTMPKLTALVAIATTFNISPTWLLLGQGEMLQRDVVVNLPKYALGKDPITKFWPLPINEDEFPDRTSGFGDDVYVQCGPLSGIEEDEDVPQSLNSVSDDPEASSSNAQSPTSLEASAQPQSRGSYLCGDPFAAYSALQSDKQKFPKVPNAQANQAQTNAMTPEQVIDFFRSMMSEKDHHIEDLCFRMAQLQIANKELTKQVADLKSQNEALINRINQLNEEKRNETK